MMDDERSVLSRRPRVFYGWWLALIGALAMGLAISPMFQGLGVFFVTLRSQFGWSQAAVSGAFSLARAEDTVIGPLVGYLTDKMGTRRMVFIGFLTLGAAYLLFSAVQNIAMFYAAFFVLAIGSGFAGFLPVMSVLNNWFIRRRASAMGISQSGVHLGGALVVPALAWGVTIADWRVSCVVLAIVMFAVAGPISAAFRNRPEDYGLLPDGDLRIQDVSADPAAVNQVESVDFTLRQALKTRAFWFISFGHAFAANVFVTMAIYSIAMIIEKGFTLGQAAAVAATFTTVAGVAQFSGGFIGDRLPKRLAIIGFILTQSLGVMIAVLAQNLYALVLFAVVFGIGAGARVPLLVAIRGDYFGRKSFATIFGFSSIPISGILIAGPILVGYLAEQLGSYNMPFLGVAIAGTIGALLIALAKRPVLAQAA